MAYIPQPDGTVQLVDDISGLPVADGVPPDMLGSLYQPPEPPTGPDLRTAQLSTQNVGPTGQMTGPTPAPGSEAVKDWFAPTVTQQAAPKESSAQMAQALAGQAPPAPTPNPSGLPLSGREQTDSSDYLRKQALASMQPRGGVAVSKPERDALRNFQVQEAPKLSEEAKVDRDLAAVRQQIAAAEGGMISQATHEDAALQYEKRRQAAKAEIGGIRDQERQRDQVVGARMREIDMLGDELRSKRKGATNPDGYWEDKGAFATVLSRIGMAIYAGGGALGGYDPMGLAKKVGEDIDRYNAAKRLEVQLVGQEIDEKKSQLGEVRKNFLSPDAADQATRALMNESLAAETASMAEHYKSAESQAVAKQLVANFQAEAADARAKAELAEKDAVTQNWQHLEAMRGVVGGSRGGDEALAKWAKARGIPYVEAVRIASKEGLPITDEALKVAGLNKQSTRGGAELQKYHESGLVQLPDGTYGYTPFGHESASKTQDLLHAMPALASNLREMGGILKGVNTIDKLTPEDQQRLKVMASENAVLFKKAPKEALTTGELEALWNVVIGADVRDYLRFGEGAQLEQAAKSAENLARVERGGLRKVPPGLETGEPLERAIPTVKEGQK